MRDLKHEMSAVHLFWHSPEVKSLFHGTYEKAKKKLETSS